MTVESQYFYLKNANAMFTNLQCLHFNWLGSVEYNTFCTLKNIKLWLVYSNFYGVFWELKIPGEKYFYF